MRGEDEAKRPQIRGTLRWPSKPITPRAPRAALAGFNARPGPETTPIAYFALSDTGQDIVSIRHIASEQSQGTTKKTCHLPMTCPEENESYWGLSEESEKRLDPHSAFRFHMYVSMPGLVVGMWGRVGSYIITFGLADGASTQEQHFVLRRR